MTVQILTVHALTGKLNRKLEVGLSPGDITLDGEP